MVSGAAGATGSVAGMIAKIKGCRVVGIAGGRAKCDWLTKEAGFDAAIDYKNEKVGDALTKHCPKGIDVYFDNVGGEILDQALARIANGARVVLCGAISQYNEAQGVAAHPPKNYFNLILHGARMEGFLVFHFAQKYPRGDRRAVEMVCRRQDQEPDRSPARPRERTQNDHPAFHRRELRQATAQALRSAVTSQSFRDTNQGGPKRPPFFYLPCLSGLICELVALGATDSAGTQH